MHYKRIMKIGDWTFLCLIFAVFACGTSTVEVISERSGNSITDTGTGNDTADSSTDTSNDTEPGTVHCDPAQLEFRVTEVTLDQIVTANEEEADLLPVVLSPISSGGSRLAWKGADGAVHITTLDADDTPVGESLTLLAHDLQDLHAEEDGGVVLLTRDALGGGTLNCGDPSNLCVAPETPIPCHDMYMVRFNMQGEQWATRLTSSSDTLPPFSTGANGPMVSMIWWYAHHGRIASNGSSNGPLHFCFLFYSSFYQSAHVLTMTQRCRMALRLLEQMGTATLMVTQMEMWTLIRMGTLIVQAIQILLLGDLVYARWGHVPRRTCG